MPTNHRVYDALNGINIKESRGNGDTILRKDSDLKRSGATKLKAAYTPTDFARETEAV